MDPLVVLERTTPRASRWAPLGRQRPASPRPAGTLTAIGAGTTYPDYKPAPFIVGSVVDGIDMVTVVTEGVFSYCGLKVKIDTDRHLGPECAPVRAGGEQVGHVTTAEYGSQMLSLGGVRHLTGGSKREGVATCAAMLSPREQGSAVDLTIDGGAVIRVQAGAPPVIDGVTEHRMRVGCGSATIGIFGPQWQSATPTRSSSSTTTSPASSPSTRPGASLAMRPAGIRVRGRRSTPGRYFQVANPGLVLGRHRRAKPPRHHRIASIPPVRLARPPPPHGQHHRRTQRLVRPRRHAPDPHPRPPCLPAIANRPSTASARTANPPSAPSSSWPVPAAPCGPAPPTTPSCSPEASKAGRTRVTAGGAPVYPLARRRHHLHRRRPDPPRQRLRLRPNPRPRRTDRIHPLGQSRICGDGRLSGPGQNHRSHPTTP